MTIEQIDKQFITEEDYLNYLMKEKVQEHDDKCACGCDLNELKCYVDRSCYVCCCQNFIYPRKGTIFENSKLPLKKWFKGIIYYFEIPKLTGQKMSELLDINYKSAYLMIKKLKGSQIIDFFKEEK